MNIAYGKKRSIQGQVIKTRIKKNGYIDVRLNKDDKSKSYLVHRLVATAYIPNPENLPQVNHLSGNKQDNSVENLAWTDASGNALHAYKTGLNSQCGCTHRLAVPVIDTVTGEVFCTEKAFCEHYGINYSTGKSALNGYHPFPKYVDLSGHSFVKYTC